MGRRKYTPEQEQEMALTTVGENDDLPPDDYESEYDQETEDVFDRFNDENLVEDFEDFSDSEYDSDDDF